MACNDDNEFLLARLRARLDEVGATESPSHAKELIRLAETYVRAGGLFGLGLGGPQLPPAAGLDIGVWAPLFAEADAMLWLGPPDLDRYRDILRLEGFVAVIGEMGYMHDEWDGLTRALPREHLLSLLAAHIVDPTPLTIVEDVESFLELGGSVEFRKPGPDDWVNEPFHIVVDPNRWSFDRWGGLTDELAADLAVQGYAAFAEGVLIDREGGLTGFRPEAGLTPS